MGNEHVRHAACMGITTNAYRYLVEETSFELIRKNGKE
jgi:hypothetical protein